MEQDAIERQMSSTNRKVDKIFNVRKVHYKQQFDHEKYLKPGFSPFQQAREHLKEPISTKMPKKGGEYNFQVAIISSSVYKDLTKKYAAIKEEQNLEKQKKLNDLREKEGQLSKFKSQKERIEGQREKLLKRRDQLRMKIEEIRQRNEILRTEQMQRNEEYRMMNMEYLRNMIIGMRYQDGQDIDVDNMTYEEMLELEEKMGSVSKGLNEEQILNLTKKVYKEGQPEELCSICYYNAKDGQEMNVLPCKHTFHVDCIKEWLEKEKVCPMCKQEIVEKMKSSKNLKESIEKLSRESASRKNAHSSQSVKELGDQNFKTSVKDSQGKQEEERQGFSEVEENINTEPEISSQAIHERLQA